MGLFDNKNDNIKMDNVQGLTIMDKKGQKTVIKIDKNDVKITTAILAGTAAILGAIFSKDKK